MWFGWFGLSSSGIRAWYTPKEKIAHIWGRMTRVTNSPCKNIGSSWRSLSHQESWCGQPASDHSESARGALPEFIDFIYPESLRILIFLWFSAISLWDGLTDQHSPGVLFGLPLFFLPHFKKARGWCFRCVYTFCRDSESGARVGCRKSCASHTHRSLNLRITVQNKHVQMRQQSALLCYHFQRQTWLQGMVERAFSPSMGGWGRWVSWVWGKVVYTWLIHGALKLF